MLDIKSLFKEAKKGIVKIDFKSNGKSIGCGSGFLTKSFLNTNNHVYATCLKNTENIKVHFKIFNGSDYSNHSLPADDFKKLLETGAEENSYDYAILNVESIKIFQNAYKFTLKSVPDISEGSSVAFLGFPFSKDNVTCHTGSISSVYSRDKIQILQIDGSINGGNSGGPLIDITDGKVIGIITRSEKGYIVENFKLLLQALDIHIKILSNTPEVIEVEKGGIKVGIIESLSKSQSIMKIIAENLHISANVGIGYAFSITPVLNWLEEKERKM